MKRQIALFIGLPFILSACVAEPSPITVDDKQPIAVDSRVSPEPKDQNLDPLPSEPQEQQQNTGSSNQFIQEKDSPTKQQSVQEFFPWEPQPSPSPANFCKVPDQRPDGFVGKPRGSTVNGITYGGPSGFPLVSQTVPTKGELNWMFVMVGFKDTPRFVNHPAEFLEPHIKKLEEWADFWSQGKLSFNISYVDYWVELPINAIDRPKEDGLLANMIVERLPEGIDPNSFDATFIHWDHLNAVPGLVQAANKGEVRFTLRIGSNENSYDYGKNDGTTSLIWAPGIYHSSNQGQSLQHKEKYAYGHWLHEILHEMGLNLHAPGNGWPTGVGQNMYPFSGTFSGAISSWEQFLLEWLDDSQVHCIDRKLTTESKAILSSLESYGGDKKMIAIPTNNTENHVLVVEAREPKGWTMWGDNDRGLLVYKVDPAAKHRDHVRHDCGNDPNIEKWAYYIFPNNSGIDGNYCGYFGEALVKEGESVSFAGIDIKLKRIYSGQFYISIKIDSQNHGNEEEIAEFSVPAMNSRATTNSGCGCCGCFPDLFN